MKSRTQTGSTAGEMSGPECPRLRKGLIQASDEQIRACLPCGPGAVRREPRAPTVCQNGSFRNLFSLIPEARPSYRRPIAGPKILSAGLYPVSPSEQSLLAPPGVWVTPAPPRASGMDMDMEMGKRWALASSGLSFPAPCRGPSRVPCSRCRCVPGARRPACLLRGWPGILGHLPTWARRWEAPEDIPQQTERGRKGGRENGARSSPEGLG